MGKNFRELFVFWLSAGLVHHFHRVILKRKNLMISIQDFNVSTFESKCDLIIYCSDYLISLETGNIKSHLYYYSEFFIEVHYSTSLKKVLAINAFNSFEELDTYVMGISLGDLIVYG